ncbi:hypothetical protein EDC01DRAFT_716145 [Geopyxis carbonaria]|nr:hypothetical protein EDC01DRAFT_716145 [Geopyxis carbonaria]
MALARLQHHVDQLQTKVNHDRLLKPPVRRIFHCVCDETALTASIPELKRMVTDKSITMLVPLSALDGLDKLKKGTEDTNIHARESIRFFDRVQQTAAGGRRAITGVRIQDPTEKFASWAECALPDTEPPTRVKDILNCTLFAIRKSQKIGGDDNDVLLVTNDEILREWAALYGVPIAHSADIAGKVRREDIEFLERRRHYEYGKSGGSPRSPTSPTGGRGGGRGRGGRGGGSNGGSRRNSGFREDPPQLRLDPNAFGRGRGMREPAEPDFILRGPTRGVARGRGRLWEP